MTQFACDKVDDIVYRKTDGLWYAFGNNGWDRFGLLGRENQTITHEPCTMLNEFNISCLAMSQESIWFSNEDNLVYVVGLHALSQEKIRMNINGFTNGLYFPDKVRKLEGCFANLPSKVIKIECTSSDNNDDCRAMFLLQNGDIYMFYYTIHHNDYFLLGKLDLGDQKVSNFVLSTGYFCYEDSIGQLWYHLFGIMPEITIDERFGLQFRYPGYIKLKTPCYFYEVNYSCHLLIGANHDIEVISEVSETLISNVIKRFVKEHGVMLPCLKKMSICTWQVHMLCGSEFYNEMFDSMKKSHQIDTRFHFH